MESNIHIQMFGMVTLYTQKNQNATKFSVFSTRCTKNRTNGILSVYEWLKIMFLL